MDGGEPRHCGRPKEVRPAPGTAHRAEQKARLQTEETSRDPPTSTRRKDRGQSPALYPLKDLIKRDDFSLTFNEPYLEFLCLLDG